MGLSDFKITNILPNSVESSFLKFSSFLRSVELVGLNMWNILLIVSFIFMVFGLLWLSFKGIILIKNNTRKIKKTLKIK